VRQPLGYKILNGNELIVQGGLEAGFSLYTGYPGSPLADYFNILYQKHDQLQGKGIKVVLANSEANAAAMASGAKQAGRNCMVAMKSMGLHVAADALSVGQFASPHRPNECGEYPGTVIVVGDDPWSTSTSTPADSRYLYKHLHLPFLQPSTPQELKDWALVALKISQKSSLYQGLLLTTFMAEGGGRVALYPHAAVETAPVTLKTAEFDLAKNVMVPPNSMHADVAMITERFPAVLAAYKSFRLDKIFGAKGSRVGLIAAGGVFETLKQVLDEEQCLEKVSLYKLASSYPLIEDFLAPWLEGLDDLIVVEEKRGFLEAELRALISRRGWRLNILGKLFGEAPGFPAHGGLSYEIMRAQLSAAFASINFPVTLPVPASARRLQLRTPRRLPTFCPGCPHRETLSLLKDLRAKLDGENIDLVSHGDVGCYSLSFLEPFKEMHNLSAMGQGGALGAGVDFFTTNPSVVLMGDSTFFHSGITDISNSVQAGHRITYILLDNDNTAMTGHQMTPRTGISVEGRQRPRQDMLNLVKHLGVAEACEVNPSDRYFYQNKLRSLILNPGVKVIISNKECGLTFHGKQKALERKTLAQGETLTRKKFYQINSAVCEDCRECVEATGCPGLTQINDSYGPKMAIDPQICVADSYCTKLEACPSFELVEVANFHPHKYKKSVHANDFAETDLPSPTPRKTLRQIADGADWRVVVTGVGGSGVTTISRVLAAAAQSFLATDKDAGAGSLLDFKFMDQKGLAQRNGTVTGHLNLFLKGKSCGAVTPLGTGDLLLSPDLLNGAQALQFLAPHGQSIIDKEFQVPLSLLLDRGEEDDPLAQQTLRRELSEQFGAQVELASFKSISYQKFGKSVYASALILGFAYQGGHLPFGAADLKAAFAATVPPAELQNNWQGFILGRKIKLSGEESFHRAAGLKHAEYLELYGKSLAQAVLFPWQVAPLKKLFQQTLHSLQEYFPTYDKNHLAQFVHDLLVFDHGKQRVAFLSQAKKLRELYPHQSVQTLALSTLVKTYWLKDEVFVAHLMVTPQQHLKNQQCYGQLGSGFKVTHINRPQVTICGRKLAFDIHPKDWMLHIVKHLRPLRILLPSWHRKERQINLQIRKKILSEIPLQKLTEQRSALQKLANIKGFRHIKYKLAESRL